MTAKKYRKRFLLPALAVAGIILAGCTIQSSSGSNQTQGGRTLGEVKEFTMVARQWEFQPSTISVNQGYAVRLAITNIDVGHGIAIPGLNVSEPIPQGQTVNVEFVANQKGSFPFFCNVYCGLGHGDMRGVLLVN